MNKTVQQLINQHGYHPDSDFIQKKVAQLERKITTFLAEDSPEREKITNEPEVWRAKKAELLSDYWKTIYTDLACQSIFSVQKKLAFEGKNITANAIKDTPLIDSET